MLKRHGTAFLSILSVLTVSLVLASSAGAVTPAPGWAISGRVSPTILPPGGEASLHLNVFSMGGVEPSAGAIVTDTLPADLTATGANHTFIYGGSANTAECLVATGHE